MLEIKVFGFSTLVLLLLYTGTVLPGKIKDAGLLSGECSRMLRCLQQAHEYPLCLHQEALPQCPRCEAGFSEEHCFTDREAKAQERESQ